jgi:hypothetical protein
MESKLHGKLEASGRVCLRDKESRALIRAYPYKVQGTDEEIEDKVKFWFYQSSCDAESKLENYFVDTLSVTELKNSEEKFID